VLLTLMGVGFVGLGVTLMATSRPRWVIVGRKPGVSAWFRWRGGALLAAGGAWLALTWGPVPGRSEDATFFVVSMFVVFVGCLLMGAHVAHRST